MRDTALEAAFVRDGYVTLPLLDPDEVASLRSVFDDLGAPPGDPDRHGTFNTWNTFDQGYKAAIDAGIIGVLGSHLADVFDRQRVLLSNFLVKYPGEKSDLQVHQDTNLVDEAVHCSAELWVALEDAHADNGQLWMVPGSHTWTPALRGISSWFRSPYTGIEERIVQRHAVAVPMRAGEAMVFNHATLHFSRANTTDRPRLAAITDVIPEETRHIHYFGNDDGTVDVFEVDEAFWMQNTPATLGTRPPVAQRVAVVTDDTPPLTATNLDALVRAGRAIDTTKPGCATLDPAARGRTRWWRRP